MSAESVAGRSSLSKPERSDSELGKVEDGLRLRSEAADPEKIRQILLNLLSNAIKFTVRADRSK